MKNLVAWMFVCVCVAGCGKPPTAMSTCHKLEAAGIASGCAAELPKGMWSDASEAVHFDLVNVPGKGGGVYAYDTDPKYESLEKSWDSPAMKAMGGPHRYGNKKRRIYTQFNDGASLEDGAKAKSIVEGL